MPQGGGLSLKEKEQNRPQLGKVGTDNKALGGRFETGDQQSWDENPWEHKSVVFSAQKWFLAI